MTLSPPHQALLVKLCLGNEKSKYIKIEKRATVSAPCVRYIKTIKLLLIRCIWLPSHTDLSKIASLGFVALSLAPIFLLDT